MQDLGGQTSLRPYWRCYYANTAAVVFVIDSTDIERLSTAAEELSAMLNEEELREASLLVFANKQDQPGAKGAGEISETLRLGELRDRNWSIVACSAIDGSGVTEGMDWLVVSTKVFRFVLNYASLTLQVANNKLRFMKFVEVPFISFQIQGVMSNRILVRRRTRKLSKRWQHHTGSLYMSSRANDLNPLSVRKEKSP